MSALSGAPAKENTAVVEGCRITLRAMNSPHLQSPWQTREFSCVGAAQNPPASPAENLSAHPTQLKGQRKERAWIKVCKTERKPLIPGRPALVKGMPATCNPCAHYLTSASTALPLCACSTLTTSAKLLITKQRCEMVSSI